MIQGRAPSVPQPRTAAPVLLFDGDCAFCSSCVRWAHRWVRPTVAMVPWQWADLAVLRVSEERCRSSVQWVSAPGVTKESAAAVAALLRTGRPPWPGVAGLLELPGLRGAADAAYQWVAANRHRLPGAKPACSADSARSPEQPQSSPSRTRTSAIVS